MNATISSEDVRARVQALPMLPEVLQDLMFAVRDDDLHLDDFSRKLAVDPALTAKILRVANSAFYGMSGSIASVQDAARLIGLRTIKTLLMAKTAVSRLQRPSCNGFDFRRFWEQSLATAICAQELARKIGFSEGQAFTAGLIHDIGSLALASYYPNQYSALLAAARSRDCPVVEAERTELGTDHCQVGAWIAEHWRFADAVAAAIRAHHDPVGHGIGESTGSTSLADIVHAADGIVHALDLHGSEDDLVPLLQLPSWERLGLAPDAYLVVFANTESTFREMRHAVL